MSDDCVDCEPQGFCQVDGCLADADYTIRDVTITYKGLRVHVGDVDVCGGHRRRAERLGKVQLSETRIFQALEAQA